MITIDGPMLMGVAALVSSLGNLATALLTALRRHTGERLGATPPRRFRRRGSRIC